MKNHNIEKDGQDCKECGMLAVLTSEECPSLVNKDYRFTDWDFEENDLFGTWEDCKKRFNEAVKKEPEGRFSIYDITDDNDEGILFNEKCPVYSKEGV